MPEYSLSDIATASRENGFGGDTAWRMIILFAMDFNGLENAVGRPSDRQAAIARQNDNAIRSPSWQIAAAPLSAVSTPSITTARSTPLQSSRL